MDALELKNKRYRRFLEMEIARKLSYSIKT